MIRDLALKKKWQYVEKNFSQRFADGESLDLDAILFIIGIQETGLWHKKHSKDDKVNIMHVGICTVLEPLGYYEFDYVDQDAWPHFKVKELLPNLKAGEQSLLMKEAIVMYLEKKNFFDEVFVEETS